MNTELKKIRDYIFSPDCPVQTRVEWFAKDFTGYCLYHFPHEFLHAPCKPQKDYCMSLQKGEDIFLVGFRELAKTMFLIQYYSWVIAYKKKRYIMHYNSDHSQAKSILLAVITIMETNDLYKANYGKLYLPEGGRKQSDVTQKTVGKFITTNFVMMEAMSVGMSPRGHTYYSLEGITYRPDLVGFDDIDTIKNIDNPEINAKDVRFILGEVFGGVAAYCQKIVLGNVIKEDGRIPRLKKHFQQKDSKVKIMWVPIRIKGVIQWDRFKATDRETDQLNEKIEDPRQHYVSLQAKRSDQGTIGFNQNFNLVAYQEGQTIISRTYIKYWHNRPKVTRVVMGIDPAYSEKTKSDPIGITITHHYTLMKLSPDGDTVKHYFIQDSFQLKGNEKNETNFCKFVEEQYIKNKVHLIRIETNNGGGILAKLLRKKNLAVIEIAQTKDKVQNMMEHQGLFERGQVFFRADMPGDLENQLLAFPNVDHDDMVDSMNLSFEDEKIGGFSTSIST